MKYSAAVMLLLFTPCLHAETGLEIRMEAIGFGDSKEHVMGLMKDPPVSRVQQRAAGVSCEELTYSEGDQSAAVTLCFSRVVSVKFIDKPLCFFNCNLH